jgi:Rod binding domain-containing protein
VSGLDALSSASAVIPADVRKAGKDAEQTYRVALGFERTLLEQLTKSMSKDMVGMGSSSGTDSDSDSGDGESSGQSAATSTYTDMLPGTLADSVTSAGGLGLAHDLWLSMRSAQS